MAAARRPWSACGARPARPAGLSARAPQTQTPSSLEDELVAVERQADLVLTLRLAQQTLAERARTVIRTAQLAGEGLAVADEALLAAVQRELRAVEADSAALARLSG